MITPSNKLTGEKLFHGLLAVNETDRVVAIGHWVTMNIIHAAMCPIARYIPLRRLLVKRFVNGDEIPASSVYNDRMDEAIVRFLARRVTAAVEFNTMKFLTSSFEAPYNIGTMASKEDVIACREEHGQEAGHAVVNQKVMKDFYSLFVKWFVVTALSFILLLFEHCSCMIRRKMGHRSHKVEPPISMALTSNRPMRRRRQSLTAPQETLGSTATCNTGDLTQQCSGRTKMYGTCRSATAVL